MKNLKMSLLENSVGFFIESAGNAISAEEDTSKWKIAILMLVQAIETGLKECLRRSHEIFLYSNIDKPKHTVGLFLAIERLEKFSGIELKKEDLESLQTASDLRNLIVHFEFDYSIDQIKSLYVGLVGFYTDFCTNYLKVDVFQALPDLEREALLSMDHYIDELESRAIARIESDAIAQSHIWLCPACDRPTFVADEEFCYLCGYQQDVTNCDLCGAPKFLNDLAEIDFGNMKRIEIIKLVCEECCERLDEDRYEDYY